MTAVWRREDLMLDHWVKLSLAERYDGPIRTPMPDEMRKLLGCDSED